MHDIPKKKLRLGLLLDSFEVPAWIYLMLKKIQNSDYAEINLIVLNGISNKKKGIFSRIIQDRKFLLYKIYKKFNDKFFYSNPNPFERKNIYQFLGSISTIKIFPKQNKYSDRFIDEDIKKIKSYDLDVLIHVGFRILKGKILESSKFGVWSFCHGDYKTNRRLPPGFWEVFEGQPITGSSLQILNEDLDAGQILYKSYSPTHLWSVNTNLDRVVWKSLSFLPRKLKELKEFGEENFFANLEEKNSSLNYYDRTIFTLPTNWEMLKFIFIITHRITKFFLYNLIFFDQWILLFDLRDEFSLSLSKFKKIIPPKDRFWADPHIVHKKNNFYIFIEEFMYNTKKGHISLIIMDNKGNYTKPEKVLERPYHLSYPFIFSYKGDYYIIPETPSTKTIEVYKCIEFPRRWEFLKNLKDNVVAADTTLFYYENKWWLFTNIVENEGANMGEELFLFYSDNPLSERWIPHPKNPIVSDISNGRPAGKIFEHNGNLFRPSQNSTKRYGYGLKFNKIINLDENNYQEKLVDSIEPKWEKNIKAVHTFNFEKKLTIIDAQLRRIRSIIH